MKRTKWIERKFSFDFPVGQLPNILERLYGTTPRIIELCQQITQIDTEYKPDGNWSIKEHIGHLSDLEQLHEGRIDDFVLRKEILQAADMSNKKTSVANHNTTSIDDLINDFSDKRYQFIQRLKRLDKEVHSFKSLHPRLRILMRPIDVAYFTAEHDDHHLASIREIIENIDFKIIHAKELFHLKTIEQLAYEIIPEFYADVIPHDHNIFFVDKFQTVKAIKEQLNNGFEYYLIHHKGKSIGYIGLNINNVKSEMILSKLYLLSEFRGLGFGAKAMEFINKKIDDLHIKKVTLAVNRNKKRTVSFYERNQFRISKELTNEFENGHIILDYEMEKLLE